MKKISILLAILILATTLITACSEEPSDGSLIESEEVSAEESKNESSQATKQEAPTYTGISVSTDAQHTDISNGAS